MKKKKREEKKGIVGSFFHNFRFHVLTRMPVGSGVARNVVRNGRVSVETVGKLRKKIGK